MNKKKEQKKHSNISWSHKTSCFRHEIAPIIRKHFSNQQIPSHLLKLCSCIEYKDVINGLKPIYTCSLLDILNDKKPWSGKNAHFAEINFQINNLSLNLQVLQGMGGEIKKWTQPNTRKTIVATGSFWRDEVIIKIANSTYYIRLKLFTKYIMQPIFVDKKKVPHDMSPFWYYYYCIFLYIFYIYIQQYTYNIGIKIGAVMVSEIIPKRMMQQKCLLPFTKICLYHHPVWINVVRE